jgi:murein DD-endopeptidase MepM/ murein hydrolase activator NlpD
MISGRFRVLPALALILPLGGIAHVTALAQGQRSFEVSLAPSSIRPGEVVRISVSGAADDHMTATMFQQSLTFDFDDSQRMWLALAGVDLDTKPGRYDLLVQRNGIPAVTRTIDITPREFKVRRLRVAEDFVNPSNEALEQIARDAAALAQTYARITPRRWTGAFIVPVDGAPTSNFGTRSYYNGVQRAPHAGVDFLSQPGTPIRATNAGTVALAEPLYFTGNTVVVDHGGGLLSVFAHLSEFHVTLGENVSGDTIVGLVGATGRVTGPHLHWSVRLHGARVDPLSLIAATQVR